MENTITLSAPVEAPAIPLDAKEQDALLLIAAGEAPKIQPGSQSRSWSVSGNVD